jgi:hypothetical protein
MRVFQFLLIFVLSFLLLVFHNPIQAAEHETVREIPVDFITEAGCPINATSSKTLLDLDPFGAPKDARIYITFKNMGQKPIAAVKFRLRYLSKDGKNKGTFHAAQAVILGPGAESKGRWMGSKISPDTSALKVRTLQVRYSDGTQWESHRMEGIVKPKD